MLYRRRGISGFTLIELLVVIAVISILAAILFPAFATARANARSVTCLSNLRQIGMAIELYSDDYDEQYPNGADPSDLYSIPNIWQSAAPQYYPQIISMPLLTDLMAPYLHSPQVWHCPSDTGFKTIDTNGFALDAQPTDFDNPMFRMSYFSRTEIALYHVPLPSITAHELNPPYTEHGLSDINMIMDACGGWHGAESPATSRRYNVLFADDHAKSQNNAAYSNTWTLQIDQ